VYAGRLAASGDFRSIRRLMTDRPHRFTIRSSDDRGLATALLTHPAVFGVELLDGRLAVQASDLTAFARGIAPIARTAGIRLHELTATDDTLESVFSYLVRR
jgi:ABC-2 type transport system ATP-binding protein